MDIDISVEHVTMRPEWHDIIDAWLSDCRRRYPDVQTIDMVLRHADLDPVGEAVDLVARARGRNLHTEARATEMRIALHDAFDALDHELALNEAIRPQLH